MDPSFTTLKLWKAIQQFNNTVKTGPIQSDINTGAKNNPWKYGCWCFRIWISQFPEAVSKSLFFFLYLYSNMAVIVLSEDVDNCVCVSWHVSHCVYTWKCNCLLSLFMFNLPGSLSKKMNNLLSRLQPGWAMWTSFLAHTYQSNFLPLLPLSILPSFPPLHTLKLLA